MEKLPESPTLPLKELNQSVAVEVAICKPQVDNHTNTIIDALQNSPANKSDSYKCKPSAVFGSPDYLKVPKPFKYPERYTSPTDHMISPISKGLLARSRRGSALLPPSKIQTKIHELRSKDVGQIQLKIEQ